MLGRKEVASFYEPALNFIVDSVLALRHIAHNSISVSILMLSC